MPIIGSLAGASSRGLGGLRTFGSPIVVGDFVALSTATVTSPQFGITFDNVSQNYKHLHLRFRISTGAENSTRIFFNDDETHANYNYTWLQGNGVSPYVFTENTYSYFTYDNTTNSNLFVVGTVDIMDYTNTNKRKTFSAWSGWSSNTPQAVQNIVGTMWKNTSAINKIVIKPDSAQNFKVGSTVALYGIKSA